MPRLSSVEPDEAGPMFAVGFRIDEPGPPLWVRWDRRTPDFHQIVDRLQGKGFQVTQSYSGAWLPLTVGPGEGVESRQICDAVTEVVAIHSNAADESPVQS